MAGMSPGTLKMMATGYKMFRGTEGEGWIHRARLRGGRGVELDVRHRRAPRNIGEKGDGPEQLAAGPSPQWAITRWCRLHMIALEKRRDVRVN